MSTYQFPEPELIIFDCDGVLVDSEMISARVFANVIQRAGINMSTMDVFKEFKGGSMGASMSKIESILGGPPSFDVEAAYRRESFEAYREEMKPVEGIIKILERLDLPSCVASNGPQKKIKFNLELANLDKFFNSKSIFSAYDFEQWKPDPTMFLAAAEAHQIIPSNCLVVGDSIADVLAANRAGMSCIGYAPMGDHEGLNNHGARVISAMDQLYDYLFL